MLRLGFQPVLGTDAARGSYAFADVFAATAGSADSAGTVRPVLPTKKNHAHTHTENLC